MNLKKKIPANIIIFGGNGDLAWRKLVPAFYNLFINGYLPEKFAIYGVHYEKIKEKDYKRHLLEGVNNFSRSGKVKPAQWKKFIQHVFYFEGDFTVNDTFRRLEEKVDANDKAWKDRAVRLFYYSVAPRFIEPISLLLAKYGLAANVQLDRIVVEKPFGTDLPSAKKLNHLLTRNFKEKQIYRIDHYLGKETVQNLLAFRFANIVYESIWNHNYIDHVQITVAESIGVGGRGGYYEQAGALRDMIQNHLLQLLCVTAMEPPVSMDAEEIRNKKADVLKAVRRLTKKNIDKYMVRGQYGAGNKQPAYRKEKNVDPHSNIETFVALKLFIDNWRWQDVPFYLRTGKCLARTTSLIVIRFKPVPHNLFDDKVITDPRPNQLLISIQPEMEITLLFHAKEPGVQMRIKPVEMDFAYKESYEAPVPEAYETLLLDVLEGDAALFMRADQVEEAWKVVTPILDTWKKEPPPRFPNYKAGILGPEGNCITHQGTGMRLDIIAGKWYRKKQDQKKMKHPASITIWKDHEAASVSAAHHFVILCQQAIAKHGKFTVALSGGNTPKRFYQLLASNEFSRNIPWQKVFLFWSDERFVSYTDPESNYRMVKENLLDHIPIPAENIFPVPVDGKAKDAAKTYEKKYLLIL
jgi:glucose-6-phosphate 1-dehydrogenase